MAMSDDPRGYRRGNQRPDGDSRGRANSRAEQPAQRGFSEDSGERQGAAGGDRPSFSAYRPEAYANGEKRSSRPEWDDARSTPRPQSPAAEAYPRPAPERPSAQADSRDPYQADPFAAPQRDFEPDWRAAPYQEDNKYANFYDDTAPPVSDAQAVHSRFFATDPEPEQPASHFRGNGGYNPPFDAAREEPAPRSGNRDREFAWDTFEQSPAPASVRPYSAQPAPHDDDMDTDFFADEDEFDGDDYPEEKRSGRTRLVAAILVGAIVTGGALAWLYKSSTHHADGSEPPPFLADNSGPTKEAPPAGTGGRKFPSKPIQARLGDGDGAAQQVASNEAAAGESAPDTSGAVTTSGGTLEERINGALRDAKKADGADQQDPETIDKPRSVSTVTIKPDGSVEAGAEGQSVGSKSRSVTPPPKQQIAAEPPVVVTTDTEAEPSVSTGTATRTQLAAGRNTRVAAVTPPPQVTESAGGTGAYFLQLGARNDQAQALAAFSILQQKYAAILGNYSPSVQKADLPGKGIWYRLRVGPFPAKADADKLCEDLKTAGLKACFSAKD